MFYFPDFAKAALPDDVPGLELISIDFDFVYFFKLKIVGFGVDVFLEWGPDPDDGGSHARLLSFGLFFERFYLFFFVFVGQ